MLAQSLAPVSDVCDATTGVRRVRSATRYRGRAAVQLELRTTKQGAGLLTEYVADGVLLFTGSDDGPQATPAGVELLADTSPRAVEMLAAFAVLQVRVFEADVGAPADACGATRGKAEEQAKCAFIGVLGCIPPAAAFTCAVSAALAVGCGWLVEKACESEPETCEPGWTEG
ncbi:hypothetical protein [Nannocystis bainbridge]|uniref:Uncharacterized protein n=1 Tax=Nannocystis bainbridge TaxID=2995303 RepID=A0ABT5DTV6_9BACT|nr:hypothetical protein [Nannocystis bainbridge]MDC0715831.1 hypothetical protein [Nannocystis bainbridge]